MNKRRLRIGGGLGPEVSAGAATEYRKGDLSSTNLGKIEEAWRKAWALTWRASVRNVVPELRGDT